MQTRVNKVNAVKDAKNHYQVTWLFEAWPNLVPLTEDPVVNETIQHEFQVYEGPSAEQDYIKQQARIDAHLAEKAAEFMDKYLDEKDLIETETRIDTAAVTLKTTIDGAYAEKVQ